MFTHSHKCFKWSNDASFCHYVSQISWATLRSSRWHFPLGYHYSCGIYSAWHCSMDSWRNKDIFSHFYPAEILCSNQKEATGKIITPSSRMAWQGGKQNRQTDFPTHQWHIKDTKSQRCLNRSTDYKCWRILRCSRSLLSCKLGANVTYVLYPAVFYMYNVVSHGRNEEIGDARW